MKTPPAIVIYPVNIRFPMERANSIQIINTCRALAQQGVQVRLLVRRTSTLSSEEMLAFYGLEPHTNLKVIPLPVLKRAHSYINDKSFYLSLLIWLLPKLLGRSRVTLFLRDLGLARMLGILKPIFKFRMIYEVHMISYLFLREQHKLIPNAMPASEHAERIMRRKETQALRVCDRIISITGILKEKIATEFDIAPHRISIIPDAANTALYDSIAAHKNKEIVYIGQLYPWKGVDILIDALATLPYRATIVGGLPYEDDLKRLQTIAEQHNIADRISFTGHLKWRDAAAYLARAAVSVIPLSDNIIARDYTSPLKLFESMAARAAIVAADLPSIREIITHEHNGLLFTPGDSHALASALQRVMTDNNVRDKIVENAYNQSARYSWHERASNITRIIETI